MKKYFCLLVACIGLLSSCSTTPAAPSSTTVAADKGVDPKSGQVPIDKLKKARELQQLAISEDKFDDAKTSLEAIRSFDEAIRLEPQWAELFFDRGISKLEIGLYDDAIEDLTKAIDIAPHSDMHWRFYVGERGLAYNLKGDFDKAAVDYSTVIHVVGKWDERERVQLFIIRRRQHLGTESNEFRNWANNFPPGFPKTTYRYLINEVTEEDLFTAAKEGDLGEGGQSAEVYEFEAYYYAGMGRLLIGDKDTARSYFERCLAIPIKADEFYLARAELARLSSH
jgi:tetratricopeptide (TPR) repeat protein